MSSTDLTPRGVEAKTPGQCFLCSGPIIRGERVEFSSGHAVHVRCATDVECRIVKALGLDPREVTEIHVDFDPGHRPMLRWSSKRTTSHAELAKVLHAIESGAR